MKDIDPIRGVLTEKEWQELLGLEYVLTWGYTHNEKKDEIRYMKLSKIRWDSLKPLPTNP